MYSQLTRKLYLLLLALAGLYPARAQDIEKLDLKKPFRLSGSVNLQLESYSASGIDNRKKPFSWMISGAPVLSILGVDMPFSFLFSNFENHYYQPFNQYGISPRYKWATLHAGYRNVHFSPYTLAGYRMLGGGLELNPKGLRFGFMYGRLNRSTELDSAQFANPLAYRPTPAYTRMAYAVKLGVGNEKNYFDISYLKGWDKENSLDSKFRDSLPPADNHVIGFSWKLSFLKHFTWQTDLGLSHYTIDTYSDPLQLDSSDPKILRRLADIFDTRITSQLLTAGETRLSYAGKWFGLGLQYKRIDPDYQSMGAYFFQSDMQQFSVLPSLRLKNGRLLINGSVGWQQDNLNLQKISTSKRFTGNASVNYNPSQVFGLSASYTNFGITRNPLRTGPADELFKQVSQSVMLAPYLNFMDGSTARNIQLVGSWQSLNSPVQSINTSPDQHTLFGTLVYSHTWLKQQLSVNASANYNNTHLSAGDIGSVGGGLGGAVPFLKQRMLLSANATYNNNRFNGQSNGYTLNADLGLRFRLIRQNSVQLLFNYLKNEAKDQTVVQTFDEKTVRVSYGLSF
ncbi:MAG: hypothetical protein P0Y53_13105 [Candidatus Pseudobacter hemicellulosilyticus]|uniref:Capsule assembly protein Wzi n=1 Tax=Candidatus Pseudobacter hemicellulosilyticus TaxID=3121375 RepID=A0AAJ6BDW5_9BACT|nr:MAG: hypothetical protein P0Y53_13105 [Pseudobacter sp.]